MCDLAFTLGLYLCFLPDVFEHPYQYRTSQECADYQSGDGNLPCQRPANLCSASPLSRFIRTMPTAILFLCFSRRRSRAYDGVSGHTMGRLGATCHSGTDVFEQRYVRCVHHSRLGPVLPLKCLCAGLVTRFKGLCVLVLPCKRNLTF
jgi:hypothetical protein